MSEVHPQEYKSQNQTDQKVYQNVENQVPSTSQNMVKIRADCTQKRSIICLIVVFSIVGLAIIPLLFTAPKQFVLKTNQHQLKGSNIQNCTNPSRIDPNGQIICQSYSQNNPTIGLFIFDFQDLNQYFLMYIQLTKLIQWQHFSINHYALLNKYNCKTWLLIGVQMVVFLANDTGMVAGNVIQQQAFRFQMSPNKANQIDFEFDDQQNSQKKYRKFLLYGLNAEYHPSNMLIQIGFITPGGLFNVNTTAMQLKAITVNPQFSLFTIILRIVFFLLSIVTCTIYFLRFRSVPAENRVVQQTLIAIQSVLLIFFNDPLYAATIIRPNGFLTFYSTFVMVNLLIFMLFTLIIFVERILYENNQRQTETINWKKIPYIAAVYILAIVTLCLLAFTHITRKPIIPQYQLVQWEFLGAQIATLVFVLLVYTLNLQFSSKSMAIQNAFVFFGSFIIFAIAMTIADGYYLFSVDRRRIFIIFWVVNFYTFFMQYLFSSSSQDIQQLKTQIQMKEKNQVGSQANSQFGIRDKGQLNNDKNFKQPKV